MKKKASADISISITVRPGRAGREARATSKITRHSALGSPGDKQIQLSLTLPSVNLHLAEALASAVIQKSLPGRKGAVMAKTKPRAISAIRRRA